MTDDQLFLFADEACDRLAEAQALARQLKETGRAVADGLVLDGAGVKAARVLVRQLTEKTEEAMAAAQNARNEL